MNASNEYIAGIKKVIRAIPDIKKIFGKNIFITGGTGMIGSALIDMIFYLNEYKDAGIRLIIAGRNKEKIRHRFVGRQEGKDFSFVYYDATQYIIPDIHADYIIHGASNADPQMFVKEPVETMLANFVGLDVLLKAAIKNHVRRVLYISSSEIYGKKQSCEKPYTETDYGYVDLLNPRACYPSAKRAAETLCAAYALEYDLDAVIVRPGHIYGSTITTKDSRASAQFTRNAIEKKAIVMKSDGHQMRSYCHVLDCASAIFTVLLKGEKGEAYNISNPNSVLTIREFAEQMARIANVDILFENPTDSECRGYNFMENSSLSSKKLEGLGWKGNISILEGINETIKTLSLKIVTNK